MKMPLKLRVPCDQHSARAQTQSNLSVSGLETRRPTPDTGYKERTQLVTRLITNYVSTCVILEQMMCQTSSLK